jgi:hypothetical protein
MRSLIHRHRLSRQVARTSGDGTLGAESALPQVVGLLDQAAARRYPPPAAIGEPVHELRPALQERIGAEPVGGEQAIGRGGGRDASAAGAYGSGRPSSSVGAVTPIAWSTVGAMSRLETGSATSPGGTDGPASTSGTRSSAA